MPARNSGISFIWSGSLLAWLSNWPMVRFAETQTPALNDASAISACCDSRSFGIVVGMYCVTRCSAFEFTWAAYSMFSPRSARGSRGCAARASCSSRSACSMRSRANWSW